MESKTTESIVDKNEAVTSSLFWSMVVFYWTGMGAILYVFFKFTNFAIDGWPEFTLTLINGLVLSTVIMLSLLAIAVKIIKYFKKQK